MVAKTHRTSTNRKRADGTGPARTRSLTGRISKGGVTNKTYTLRQAYDAIRACTFWKPKTQSDYKDRLIKAIRVLRPAWAKLKEDDLWEVDLVGLFNNPDNIQQYLDNINNTSKAVGTPKDYFQAVASLAKRASPHEFGELLSKSQLRWIEQIIKDYKSVRQVADANRTYTDKDHEPYENIQTAGKWYKDRKVTTQSALIASMYADNPVFVRDNYGSLKMDYGTTLNKKYNVPEPDRAEDTYYDVKEGVIYITDFKNARHGHRPYDIKINQYTKWIIDKQLSDARKKKDWEHGYRHYLFYKGADGPNSSPKEALQKLGQGGHIDRALRGAKDVEFTLGKVLGPNVLRVSYVTWRVSQAGVSQEEMMCLARDMRHSYAVQQLVYKRLNKIT